MSLSLRAAYDKLWQGQYVDGLRAPLIIHPPKRTFSYDDEFTVILSDWYHEEHPELLKRFINSSNPDGVEPVAGECCLCFHLTQLRRLTRLGTALLCSRRVVSQPKVSPYLLRGRVQ